mmetsp:Transcript_16120/g.30587  ORF Transcript_16120/g.30587 Transcript_16120/m.30587 type:complete len:347 (-) Transcript_16120:220-1260(-)
MAAGTEPLPSPENWPCSGKLKTSTLLAFVQKFPFDCPSCRKRFRMRKEVHDHAISARHVLKCPRLTTEEPLRMKCPKCFRRFDQRYRLKRHFLVHTGEKPYTCTICKKNFSQRGNLNQHIKIHKTNVKCSKCDKEINKGTNHVCSASRSEKAEKRDDVRKKNKKRPRASVPQFEGTPYQRNQHERTSFLQGVPNPAEILPPPPPYLSASSSQILPTKSEIRPRQVQSRLPPESLPCPSYPSVPSISEYKNYPPSGMYYLNPPAHRVPSSQLVSGMQYRYGQPQHHQMQRYPQQMGWSALNSYEQLNQQLKQERDQSAKMAHRYSQGPSQGGPPPQSRGYYYPPSYY